MSESLADNAMKPLMESGNKFIKQNNEAALSNYFYPILTYDCNIETK
jgi:hypothetical protein